MSTLYSLLARGGVTATVAVALVSHTGLAQAQDARVPVTPPTEVKPITGVPGSDLPPKTPQGVQLACCRCLGEVASSDLGTGAAPWLGWKRRA